MSPFLARLLSLIFMAVGGGLLYTGINSVMEARASSSWPSVQGRIVSASVGEHKGTKSKRKTTYHADVRYDYQVNGQTYDSKRISFGEYSSRDRSHAEEELKKYPVGKQLPVYYSPTNPASSVLEPGLSTQTWFLPGFGLIFGLAGLGMFFFLPGAMARQRAARLNR